ncbi:uncharacterized protein LOC108668838 isoform X2 [Hyalella azteca]|uniref:Uncharacterized protein LOC108668838 isoform X2 n=1 Tax=Hyalella azteca TaxID=294128 RepID=A0A8B7NDB1_HYAAZ|nr:uncharacterized protein LOC108668838 isoform X2 [Hyalella azteca]
MLATGGDCIKLWDLNDFKLKQIYPSRKESNVMGISWSNDGGCLGSFCSDSNEVSLRAVRDTSSLQLPSIKTGCVVRAIDYAHKAAEFVAVVESSGQVIVWNTNSVSPKKTFQLKDKSPTSIAFSASDSHLAVGGEAGSVHLLSFTNSTITGPYHITSCQGGVKCVKYSALRRGVLSVACWDGSVACLDCNTGKTSSLAQRHSAPCSALAFSPTNELLLVSAGYDKKLIFYNINSLKTVQLITCDAPLTTVAFLPDGLKICAGTMSGEALLYDLRNLRTPQHSWSAHSGALMTMAPRPAASKKRRTPHQRTKTLSGEVPEIVVDVQPPTEGEAPSSKYFSSTNLDDLSADVFSPVRDAGLFVESSARDKPLAKDGAPVMKLASLGGNEDCDADAANYDADGLLSPVRGAADMAFQADDMHRTPYASSRNEALVTDSSISLTPRSSRRDESIRSSLLRMAGEKSTYLSPKRLAGKDLHAISPERLMSSISAVTSPRQNLNKLDVVPLSAKESIEPFTTLEMKQSEKPSLSRGPFIKKPSDEHGSTSASKALESHFIVETASQTSGQTNDVILDRGSKTQQSFPSPAMADTRLFYEDDVLSPLRDGLAVEPACVWSSKKVSDRLAAIDDLVRSSVSPTGSPSRSKTHHDSKITHLSPKDKENVPQKIPFSPAFDPSNSTNVRMNESQLHNSPRPKTAMPTVIDAPQNQDKLLSRLTEHALHEASNKDFQFEKKTPRNSATNSTLECLLKNYENIVNKLAVLESPSARGSDEPPTETETTGQEDAAPPAITGNTSATSQSLTLALVRSCVADSLDELETRINRRFIHLNYTLLTTLVQQTREIEELHKKYSLNEELLEENLRLQEEIRYLRANY